MQTEAWRGKISCPNHNPGKQQPKHKSKPSGSQSLYPCLLFTGERMTIRALCSHFKHISGTYNKNHNSNKLLPILNNCPNYPY